MALEDRLKMDYLEERWPHLCGAGPGQVRHADQSALGRWLHGVGGCCWATSLPIRCWWRATNTFMSRLPPWWNWPSRAEWDRAVQVLNGGYPLRLQPGGALSGGSSAVWRNGPGGGGVSRCSTSAVNSRCSNRHEEGVLHFSSSRRATDTAVLGAFSVPNAALALVEYA